MDGQENAHRSGEFPPTRWSMLRRLSDGEEDTRQRLLGEFCIAYWQALYCFVRRSGWSDADAKDAVQGFLAGRIGFLDIARIVEETLTAVDEPDVSDLGGIADVDRRARAAAQELLGPS